MENNETRIFQNIVKGLP